MDENTVTQDCLGLNGIATITQVFAKLIAACRSHEGDGYKI